MKIEVVQTIKKTLEESKNITVLSLTQEDNILFGVYVNNVRDSLSFLALPKSHFETTIGGINIQFFELGTVLHNIYFNGALKFIDILCPNDDLIEASHEYLELYNFVLENIPFNVAKLKYIEAVSQNFEYEKDINKILMLNQIMLNFRTTLLLDNNFDSFTYTNEVNNKNDFVKICNQLNYFKQELEQQTFKKISEKNMYKLDSMYVDIQISYIKI